MDILHRDTVTLFNLYEKSRLDPMWYATVLHNVRIEMDKSAIIAKYGADTSDNAVLHIPYTLRDLKDGEPQAKQIPWLKGKALVIEDKIWLPANEWDDQMMICQTQSLLKPGTSSISSGSGNGQENRLFQTVTLVLMRVSTAI